MITSSVASLNLHAYVEQIRNRDFIPTVFEHFQIAPHACSQANTFRVPFIPVVYQTLSERTSYLW